MRVAFLSLFEAFHEIGQPTDSHLEVCIATLLQVYHRKIQLRCLSSFFLDCVIGGLRDPNALMRLFVAVDQDGEETAIEDPSDDLGNLVGRKLDVCFLQEGE